MSKKKDAIEIRSEQVQEILTKVPSWMIRWGNLLFLFLILMLLSLSWFIKYPDVIVSNALITTHIPLQKIYAKTSGKLDTVLIRDNELVEKNQVLAIMENSAEYKDVFKLISLTNKIHINNREFDFPINDIPILSLGNIGASYALFENNYTQYLLIKELTNNAKTTILANNNLDVIQRNEELKILRDVIKSYSQLKNKIRQWDTSYVLRSKIDGQVALLNYSIDNQKINKGDLLFNVIPSKNSGYIAKLSIPASDANKIEIGQRVNINLDNYPQTKFGTLEGEIIKKSQLPDINGFYWIEVSLPDGLITTNKSKIVFIQELRGSAEIITKDLRLIERLFNQASNVFSN